MYLCVPLNRGPWHLVSLSPEACVTMWPPFIAPDTDLLVGSLLHPPEPLHQAPLRLVAGHQPLAGQKRQPIQGINPCTSLSDPSVPAGLLGVLGGMWHGVSALVGRRRPKATWLAT